MKTYCSPFRRLFCLLLLVAHPLRAQTTAKDSTGTIAAAAVATDTGEDTQAAPWPPHEKCATCKLQHYLLHNLTEQDLRLVTTKTLCGSESVNGCTCLSSSLDHVMNPSRRLTQGYTILVHTIATGVGVDRLHQPKHPLPNPEHPNQTCYVAIVEKASSLWIASGNRHGQRHLIAIDGTLPFKSSRQFLRVFKIAPALFFDAGVAVCHLARHYASTPGHSRVSGRKAATRDHMITPVRSWFTLPSFVQCIQNKSVAGPLGAPQHFS